jgi:hypothetical protein
MDSAKFSEKQIVSYKPFKNRHYDWVMSQV